MKKQWFILVLLPALLACENEVSDRGQWDEFSEVAEAEGVAYKSAVPEEETMADVDIYQFTSAQPVQQKLLKTAYLTLQVDRIEQVYANTKELISQSGGFIANDDMNNFPERKSRNMVIRVPSEKLESLVDQISAQGVYVESRSINVNDVSEEFVDIEIRLQNKRAVLEQYRKLLDKATKVEDILKIENELRQISEEIESKEGRLRFLSDRVKLSTIHLSMYEEISLAQAPPAASFWIQALESLKSGWSMIIAFCLLMLRLWPLWLIVAGIWISIKRLRTRKTFAKT